MIGHVGLRKHRFCAVHAMDEHMLHAMRGNMDVRVARSMIMENLETKIIMTVLGTDAITESAEFPVTWWDAVKAEFFPKWLLRRCPVRMKRIELRRFAVYPEIPSDRYPGDFVCVPILERNESEFFRGGRGQ